MFTSMSRLAGLSLLVVLSACGDPDAAAPPAGRAEAGLAGAQRHATKTVDVAALNRALETFYVQEGRFPKDLFELVERGYLRELPTLPAGLDWNYDATNGLVTIERKAS